MGSYANQTSVSVEKSIEQIKSVLRRYGADRFGVMEERDRAFVAFTVGGLNIQLEVPLPDRGEFAETETGRERSDTATTKAHEQAIKQRWRALLLAIKAKLEAVECGISTIECEFLPFVILADGQSISQKLLPVLHKQIDSGQPLQLEAK